MDELVIKVPAPFSGVGDVGFTARYPMQEWNEPLRDVPFIVEGPPGPMGRLVERLQLFVDKDQLITNPDDDEAYTWTTPVSLSDQICVLAFRDRSLERPSVVTSLEDDSQSNRSYVWNLVRPLAFTFLRDCVRIGGLRLEDRIEFILDPGDAPTVDLEMQRISIISENGSRLLFSA